MLRLTLLTYAVSLIVPRSVQGQEITLPVLKISAYRYTSLIFNPFLRSSSRIESTRKLPFA
jgi:hypothetical protein